MFSRKQHKLSTKLSSRLEPARHPAGIDRSHSSFPDGVKVLHDCRDAVVDICFIHGLTGNRERTWTADGQPASWPQTLLPSKLERARILTYGYDAYVVRKSGASSNRLIDHATNLLNDLTTNRADLKAWTRPIIFVAHSLGGLVCKKSLLLSRNNPEPHLKDIFNCTKGIVFMGTPHAGSWMADWAEIPVHALGIVTSVNQSLLTVLKTDDQLLESIQVEFIAMIRELREKDQRIQVTCFFEELALSGGWTVVPKSSATFAGFNPISIHADHRDMVRFASSEENGFKRLLGELRRWTKEISNGETANQVSLLVRPPDCMVPFKRYPRFAGRTSQLKELVESLFEGCYFPKLATVAAVVQYIEFGGWLLSASYEVHVSPSGPAKKEVELSTLLDDLTNLAGWAKEKLQRSPKPSYPTADIELSQLFGEFDDIAHEINRALDSLTSSVTTKFSNETSHIKKSEHSALVSIWKDPETTEMFERLEKLQRQAMTFTVLYIWGEAKEEHKPDIYFRRRLDEMIQMLQEADERAYLTGSCTSSNETEFRLGSPQPNSFEKQVTTIINDASLPVSQELVEHLWDRKWTPSEFEPNKLSSGNHLKPETIRLFNSSIISSLAFKHMQDRVEAIPRAFQQTFSWIFQREPTKVDEKPLWSSFPAWLESDTDQAYWITGKPGSGKSTLMKYIFRHSQLEEHLKGWAGEFPLLVTSYYAWISGLDLQKSCEGLMRTLLYQTLKINPSLLPTVAPRRWSLFVTLRGVVKERPWQLWELEESFNTLLSGCGKTMRLAVFIDGLDEFEIPPMRIMELVQKIYLRQGIKVCVASREWNEFSDALNHHPMLRMQDLTAADMAHFIKISFENNQGFLDLKKVFYKELNVLMDDIAKKANGVFLWLSLVVKTLLQALTEGDKLGELQAIVESLPEDIAQLYSAIWASINPRNISSSSELLHVLRASDWSVNYLTLWLADEEQSLDLNVNSLSKTARSGIANNIKRRLDSRTRGILEMSRDGQVGFLHRTAREWASRPEIWEDIRSTLPEHFDPYLLLLKAEVMSIVEKSDPWMSGTSSMKPQTNAVLQCAFHVKNLPANNLRLVSILDEFDSKVERLYQRIDATRKLRPNWPSNQEPAGCDNNFLGLTARFCVVPYLEAKLSSDKRLLSTEPGCMSLVENAVFGLEIDVTAGAIPLSNRRDTVKFLLERGASPRQVMVKGRSVVDEVRSRKMRGIGLDKEKYWMDVEELFRMNKRVGGSLIHMFWRTLGL